jgi:hypothetical protein
LKTILLISWLVTLVVFLVFPWEDQDSARATLAAQGFTRVVLTGHAYFACGDDMKCTTFSAVGPTGRAVRGAVGCGMWMKGCTIRVTP